MRFLHCSDVHMTADYARLPLGPLGWRRWLALLEQLAGRRRAFARAPETFATLVRDAERLGVAHLIVSGDLTQYALEPEFVLARQCLGALADQPQRCTVVPGNHDVFTPGSHRTGRFARHFAALLGSDLPEHQREGAFPFVRRVGEDAAVVGLSSARVPPVPGLAYGRIGTAQLEGLEAVVKDPRLAGRALLVVVHHAPLTARGRADTPTHGLQDARELLALLPGPRFAVLHGHIHQRYHHPATDTRPHVFSAGSSTQAGREGYWLIDVDAGQVRGGQRYVPGGTPAPAAVPRAPRHAWRRGEA